MLVASKDIFFAGVLFIAMLFPSSIKGEQSLIVAFMQFSLLLLLLCIFYLRYCKVQPFQLVLSFFVAILYVYYTLTSDYTDYAMGHVLSVLPLLIFIVLRVRTLPSARVMKNLYYLSVVIVFFFAYSHIYFSFLSDIILDYYAGGYDGLALNFKQRLIPVSIFVSHSYAAFFYFVIFYLSFFLHSKGVNRTFNLTIIAICFISLFLLFSGSGYFFLLYALAHVVLFFLLKRSSIFFVNCLKFFVFVFTLTFIFKYGYDFLSAFIERIIGDSSNGLLARYVGGVLKNNIEFIANNPLGGLGFSYSEKFFYTDSDYLVMALRIGLPGAVLFFSAIFFFLLKNLSKNVSMFFSISFIVAVFVFMISMPISIYYRTIPYFILTLLILNSYSTEQRRMRSV